MLKRALHLIPILIGLALAAIVAGGLYAEQERHLQKARLEVFYKLSTIQNGFENGLNTRLHLAEALKSFIMLNQDLDQKSFASLAKSLTSDDYGIRFIELAKDNVITHVYPETDSTRVQDRALLTDFPADIRRLTLLTMQTRQQQISTPTTVIEGGEAIISATPVYLPDDSPANPGKYWGTILLLIDTKTLYREAGLNDNTPILDIALRQPGIVPGQSIMLYGSNSVFNTNPVTMNIPIPDGYWQVAAVPAGGWPISPNRPIILLGGGSAVLIVTGLLTLALFLLLSHMKEKERYRYLIQNAKSIILRIDLAGNIVFCNEYAEVFYGYAPGELIGKSLIGTLIPEKNLEGESMKRYVNRLLDNPSAHPFNETVNLRKNGEMVWVAWANESVLGRDGHMAELLCVGTDITDRKLMEDALKNRERQYRLLTENITDVIIGLDADMRITYISPSDETLRGFKRYDVLGRPIGDFLTRQSEQRLIQALNTLSPPTPESVPPPTTTLDLEFACADSSTVWLETRFGLLVNDDGHTIGMQGLGRDITDRNRAEALREDVERMTRHDLKTPLGAVIGLPGEIRRLGELSPAQEGMLITIEAAGETMLQLINRSLDLFKMECGTYVLAKTGVDLIQIFTRIKNESRAIIREKGVSIGIEVLGDNLEGHFIVAVEEDLFQSLLSNLMLNALQASPNDGSISVTLSKNGGISISICNQGEVPTSMRDIFFEKYATDDGSSGSGLGTYSARLIARTHGGDIAVNTSSPGKTCVVVTLPDSF